MSISRDTSLILATFLLSRIIVSLFGVRLDYGSPLSKLAIPRRLHPPGQFDKRSMVRPYPAAGLQLLAGHHRPIHRKARAHGLHPCAQGHFPHQRIAAAQDRETPATRSCHRPTIYYPSPAPDHQSPLPPQPRNDPVRERIILHQLHLSPVPHQRHFPTLAAADHRLEEYGRFSFIPLLAIRNDPQHVPPRMATRHHRRGGRLLQKKSRRPAPRHRRPPHPAPGRRMVYTQLPPLRELLLFHLDGYEPGQKCLPRRPDHRFLGHRIRRTLLPHLRLQALALPRGYGPLHRRRRP